MKFPERKSFQKTISHRLAVLSELLAPVLRFGASLAVRQGLLPPAQWKRALIVGDTHIGDLLYRTCSLAQLQRGLPQCEWQYLTAPSTAEVLEGNPALAGILPLRNSDRLSDLKPGGWEHLRALQFDAILCTNAVRSSPELALALKLKIPNRAAYAHRGLSGLITHPVYPQNPQPFPGYFRDMVAALTDQPPDWPLRPVVHFSRTNQDEAEKLWHQFGFKPSEKVVAGFITTRQINGAWPAEWFGEVLRAVQKTSECRIVLCGASRDKSELEKLRRDFTLSAELNSGLLGLKSLVAFLSKCHVVLTQDSGPRHLGNAAGIPVVFVRNASFDAVEAGIYCKTEIDLMPAHINRLSSGTQNDMLQIVPPSKGIEAVLSKFSAKTTPHAL